MRLKVNDLIYDSTDPLCKCILSDSQGKLYAFIQVVDIGMKEKPLPKRYWGKYSHDDAEGSIREIMKYGGKWPHLPDMPR